MTHAHVIQLQLIGRRPHLVHRTVALGRGDFVLFRAGFIGWLQSLKRKARKRSNDQRLRPAPVTFAAISRAELTNLYRTHCEQRELLALQKPIRKRAKELHVKKVPQSVCVCFCGVLPGCACDECTVTAHKQKTDPFKTCVQL